MSDIVKRLKVLGKGNGRQFSIYTEAADEIENLRAALAPFVDAGHFKVVTNVGTTEEYNQVSISVRENKLRAAAAALKETGVSKKDDAAYCLQTLCHPASEFLADGQRLTLFIKRGNEAASEILRLRAENEKLRAALVGVTSELGTFVGIFKGYQGMTMNNAQAALRAAAAALKETGDE